MQSEPEVCADSGGGRALFTFHPAVLGLFFFFFAWAPVLLAVHIGDYRLKKMLSLYEELPAKNQPCVKSAFQAIFV